MADLDRLNDVVLEYADKYARELASRAPVDTGRLRQSYKASVSQVENKLKITIFGEYYGPFQSYGVGPGRPALIVPEGVNPPPLNGTKYEFKNPNRYIRPTNFINESIEIIEPEFKSALEEAGVKDVEDFFNGLQMIKLS